MKERVLTSGELNRALLARQLLLERSRLPLTRALEQLAGIQTQYAPSAYIRLWTSLERFELADLTRALERKQAVQATLMRSTIHVVSRRDYWPFSAGVGPSFQEWWRRVNRKRIGDADVDFDAIADELRSRLAGRTWHRKELDAVYREHESPAANGAWVELVRVPPSGTWERRRADLFRLASEWIGPGDVTEEQGHEHLLRRYLQGFGPARILDAADWAGSGTAKMRAAAERLRLRTFRDEEGMELLDLRRAPLPPGDTPAPPRFLPTWDAALLVHARRKGLLPEEYRPLIFHTKAPQSFPTFTVDGAVAGKWRVDRAKDKATLALEPFEGLSRMAGRELRDEGERLVRLHEPDAVSYKVRRA
jgi:Winged helix DNA-binding domain